MRALYLIHDGQNVSNQSNRLSCQSFAGLIGGHCVYDEMIDTALLPLGQAVPFTLFLRRVMGMNDRLFVVAASLTPDSSRLIFVIDSLDGQIFVLTQDQKLIPASPNGIADGVCLSSSSKSIEDAYASSAACAPDAAPDFRRGIKRGIDSSLLHVSSVRKHSSCGMLRWLEEHVRKLENGLCRVRPVPREWIERNFDGFAERGGYDAVCKTNSPEVMRTLFAPFPSVIFEKNYSNCNHNYFVCYF